jgi:hypothetical protein
MKCEYEPRNGALFEKTRALILFWLEHPEVDDEYFSNYFFRFSQSFQRVTALREASASKERKCSAMIESMREHSLVAHLRQLRVVFDQLLGCAEAEKEFSGEVKEALMSRINEVSFENAEGNRRDTRSQGGGPL